MSKLRERINDKFERYSNGNVGMECGEKYVDIVSSLNKGKTIEQRYSKYELFNIVAETLIQSEVLSDKEKYNFTKTVEHLCDDAGSDLDKIQSKYKVSNKILGLAMVSMGTDLINLDKIAVKETIDYIDNGDVALEDLAYIKGAKIQNSLPEEYLNKLINTLKGEIKTQNGEKAVEIIGKYKQGYYSVEDVVACSIENGITVEHLLDSMDSDTRSRFTIEGLKMVSGEIDPSYDLIESLIKSQKIFGFMK